MKFHKMAITKLYSLVFVASVVSVETYLNLFLYNCSTIAHLIDFIKHHEIHLDALCNISCVLLKIISRSFPICNAKSH